MLLHNRDLGVLWGPLAQKSKGNHRQGSTGSSVTVGRSCSVPRCVSGCSDLSFALVSLSLGKAVAKNSV